MSAGTLGMPQRRNLRQRRFRQVLAHVGLVVLCFVILFPLLNVFFASFKSASELYRFPPQLLPERLGFENYAQALREAPLLRFMLNSFAQSVLIVIGQVATSVLAGYAFAKIAFPAKRLLFGVVIATLLVPGEVVIIPNFFTIDALGLLDTLPAIVLPFLASAFGIFLMRQFFMTVPADLLEAARLDGAGHLRFLLHIGVPLARPAIASLTALSFLGAWNAYFWPLLVLDSAANYTVQIGLASFENDIEGTQWQVVAAATTLVLLPTLVIFFLAQKHFVKGIGSGGVKG